MSVIAHDPEVHLLPAPIALGVVADSGGGLIDDLHRGAHERSVVPQCVRRLVDTGERAEGKLRAFAGDVVGDEPTDMPVDGEPTAHIAPKVRECRARDEAGPARDLFAARESALNHAERREP